MRRESQTELRKALDDIRSLANEMKQRSSFRTTFDDFHIMAPDEIRDWQDIVRELSGDAAYTLPAELVEIYGLTGGFDFRWECRADSGLIAGAFVLASLPELFQRDDEADMTMRQAMTKWRRFDSISSGVFTAIRLDDFEAGLRCVHFKSGVPMHMNISPSDYIIAAANHVGIIGWQTGDTDREERIVRELAEWE